jgi:predicted Zn-dependent peptidase
MELAEKYVAAGRLMIVLVGDVTESEALKALEGNFGSLEASSSSSFDLADAAQISQMDVSDAPPAEKRSIEGPSNEKRRTEISSETATEVLAAWQIPPLSGTDGAMLAFFAEILNGSGDSWLNGRLVKERGCSSSVQVIMGVPGGRGPSLFVVRADVSDGHTVHEVEKAIQGAVQDSLSDDWGFIEINSAVNRLDAKHARRLADAPCLAQELIGVYGSTGGWEPAVMQPSHGLELEQASLKSFLQPIFAPGLAYSVFAEQDPILSPRSLEHQRLISLLGQLLKKRGHPPESAESKIKETLRQFGLMPKEMRGQLFKLLEAEAGY